MMLGITSQPAGRIRVCLIALHFAEYSKCLAVGLLSFVDLLVVVYEDNVRNELGDDWRQSFKDHGIRVESLRRPRNIFDVLKNSRQLVGLINSFSADVLHVQEEQRDELILALVHGLKLPIVLTIHDPHPHSGRDAKAFRFSRHRIYRSYLRRRANFAITHGDSLLTQLEQDWPNLKGVVASIPHGPLGPCDTSSGADRDHDFKSELRLIFFGRINAYKGLGAFVQLIESLHASGSPVVGVVAGRGDDLDGFRNIISTSSAFELHDGYIPAAQVDELFKKSYAVVLPYVDGTQSGVAALALGYGLPVIATRVGAIPELVHDDVNGLLVPPGDAVALECATRKLLESHELHARLSSGARNLAQGDLSWRKIANRTVEVYLKAIDAH